MKLEIREITFGSSEYDAEVRLRSRILRDPLGLKFSAEDLAREGADIHLGAFHDEVIVGCLLLLPLSAGVMKMRQVAVATEAQGLGVGKRLVSRAEELSRARGFREMQLNARDTAVPFYLAQGYETVGEIFTEVGIPHRKMRKTL